MFMKDALLSDTLSFKVTTVETKRVLGRGEPVTERRIFDTPNGDYYKKEIKSTVQPVKSIYLPSA